MSNEIERSKRKYYKCKNLLAIKFCTYSIYQYASVVEMIIFKVIFGVSLYTIPLAGLIGTILSMH